jgi:hypothetical protein
MQARMRQTYLFAVVAAASVVVLCGAALAQSNNPHVGMWKANIAKSKVVSGTPIKSTTTKIEAAGAGVKYIVDGAYADSSARHWQFTANYDGKDNRVTGNSPYGDVVALTRVNATTVRIVNKSNGKVTATQTSVVSSDGRMRTVTTTGTDALGQSVNTVIVYDKQ